ncbi:MAG TPA: LPS export ABC transporter permease LptG [Kaistiaceae bacterium]|nr:LPS export ABC transporter permease LptG [Kaistiaceae bacterium]
MIGGGTTFGLYVAGRFARSVLVVFAVCVALLFLLDFVELMRRAGEKESIDTASVALISLYRVPALSERLLPFAVLFGAMSSLLMLSRKLELVVARAAGISVWQFLTPPLLFAVLLGVFTTAVYNPVSAQLKVKSERLEVALFSGTGGGLGGAGEEAWLRQDGEDGQSVLHARKSADQGLTLGDVTVYSFDRDGNFQERIEARTATLKNGRWELADAEVGNAEGAIQHFDSYFVATYLTPTQVRESFASADTVSIWQLPDYIALAERAGLSATKFRLQFQSLLARPALLAAMVLIAATVSLRVFRFGNIGRMILGGVAAGFLLYVLSELAEDFGSAGIVHPAIAAWAPAIVAALFGATVLLYQEDG